MGIYKIKLKSRKEVALDTMEFRFTKPEGLEFRAGQFADYTLTNPPETDEKGNIRGFSFSSAPFEEDVMFTTRMENTAFKRSMKEIPLGTEVTLDAPYGSFVLHNKTTTPAVFLSGGIGITPVRSIILQATHDRTAHKLFLFYANRTPKHAAYLDDFREAQTRNPNFKFIPFLTDTTDLSEAWTGETGYFTKMILQKYIGDLTLPIYYVSGPQKMVASIRRTLDESGIDSDNIRTEEFSGYESLIVFEKTSPER
jgi:ferredoxin-NADP reductase